MDRLKEFFQNVIVLDTETTSLDFKIAEVIELGYCIRNEDDWHTISNLYRATSPISPDVSSVTHITEKMVTGKDFFGKAITRDLNPVLETLVGVGHIVAHNSVYDENVLKNYSMTDLKTPWLCTMRIAKKLFGNDKTVSNYKLVYLRYRFDLDIPETMSNHRAGSDAYMTAKLLEYLIQEMITRNILDDNSSYAEQLSRWMNEPVISDTMHFGKWKGTALKDVPMSYWSWALGNLDSLNESKPEYDKDFAASVALALEKII